MRFLYYKVFCFENNGYVYIHYFFNILIIIYYTHININLNGLLFIVPIRIF